MFVSLRPVAGASVITTATSISDVSVGLSILIRVGIELEEIQVLRQAWIHRLNLASHIALCHEIESGCTAANTRSNVCFANASADSTYARTMFAML